MIRWRGRLSVDSCGWRNPAHQLSAPLRWESAVMNGPPGAWVLELGCVLDAPREWVFRSLTEPAELARWWGPNGFSTPEIELDLTVGGGYRFAIHRRRGTRSTSRASSWRSTGPA